MSDLEWVQNWYSSMCDGDWEHQHGIRISTIDNPGWHVRISLRGVELLRPDLASGREGDVDWYTCRIRDNYFEAFGGKRNLNDMLGAFREWLEKSQPIQEIEVSQ